VDRPLTQQRHWRRNIGRLVTVVVGPAGHTAEVTGRLTDVEDIGVTLAVEAQGKPGAKKRPPTPRQVPWAELGKGRVQVEFGRPGAGDDDLAGDLTDDLTDDPVMADDIERSGIPPARGGAQ